MARSGYKHWRNDPTPGQLMFVTTTCLDFAHLFARPVVRTAAAMSILRDCIHYQAPLYAYVVMPHHVHLLVQAPTDKTVSWLMQRIKTNSAKAVRPLLMTSEIKQLSQQVELNKCQIWMRSFRGVAVDNRLVLDQKSDYIHNNPVKAELCENTIDYPWSSATAAIDGVWSEESGLARACVETLERTLQTEDL